MLLRSRCILCHCLEEDTYTHIYTHTHIYIHTQADSYVYSTMRSATYPIPPILRSYSTSLSLSFSLGEPLRPRTRNNKKEQRKAAETAIINPFEKFAIVAKLVTGNSFVVMKEFRGICGVGKVTEETLFLLPSLYLSLSREERI